VPNGLPSAFGYEHQRLAYIYDFWRVGESLYAPALRVEREYAVRIFGELTEGQMTQLTEGIELEDGPANFDSITPQGGEGANHWYQVILREGRNREVRRLFEAFQLPVSRLMRVRFGQSICRHASNVGQMLKLEQRSGWLTGMGWLASAKCAAKTTHATRKAKSDDCVHAKSA